MTPAGAEAGGRPAPPCDRYLERYRSGEWRARIFCDMVLNEIAAAGPRPTVLDIGCGRGFDDDLGLQRRIAGAAGTYIGVEPDAGVALGDYFHRAHRCTIEEAPLGPGSVDVAFAVMVLEHLADPARFWAKLHDVLRDGGAFWGFTMDARHWFSRASTWADRLRIKDLYLDLVRGRRGIDRYENYPVRYLANTPEQVVRQTGAFRHRDFLNLARVGQLAYYLPGPLRPLGRALDRRAIARGKPGMLLAVRVVK